MITNERVLGAIEVVNTKSGRPYGDSDKDVLALIAFLAALAIVRAEEVQAGA
jgi:GAF domain-containing protein